jgi:hypothetical protein
MTTTADITLASEALRLLGEFSISALDEGTDLAETVQRIQGATVRALLTTHPWRFTMRKQRLGQIAEPPINEWTYAHALPAQRLAIRAMYPAAGAGALPTMDWEVFENRAFSHHADLWCDFQVEVDPGAWPPWFYNLARYALAADFAMAVGAGTTMAQAMHQRAYGNPGESLDGGLMRVARRIDSQQQPPQRIRSNPLMAARFAGRAFR